MNVAGETQEEQVRGTEEQNPPRRAPFSHNACLRRQLCLKIRNSVQLDDVCSIPAPSSTLKMMSRYRGRLGLAAVRRGAGSWPSR
jgi:hypothetical protein